MVTPAWTLSEAGRGFLWGQLLRSCSGDRTLSRAAPIFQTDRSASGSQPDRAEPATAEAEDAEGEAEEAPKAKRRSTP